MNEKKKEKMEEKLRCIAMKIVMGDSETPGHVCLLGESEDLSINVVNKEHLKKAVKKAIEKEK